jgi:hypothetical protein
MKRGMDTRFSLTNLLTNTYNVPIWAKVQLQMYYSFDSHGVVKAQPAGAKQAMAAAHAALQNRCWCLSCQHVGVELVGQRTLQWVIFQNDWRWQHLVLLPLQLKLNRHTLVGEYTFSLSATPGP